MSDWIEFEGDSCPIDPGIKINAYLRGVGMDIDYAGRYAWGNLGLTGEVIKYRIIEGEDNIESDQDKTLKLSIEKGDRIVNKAGVLSCGSLELDDIEFDPGEHYRKFVGDINVDPALLDKLYGPMTGMQFTILKKALRMGKAHKDRKQDLLDIISAAKRELELLDE